MGFFGTKVYMPIAHRLHVVLKFGRDRPNKEIRTPKVLPKMANFSVSEFRFTAAKLLQCRLSVCLT